MLLHDVFTNQTIEVDYLMKYYFEFLICEEKYSVFNLIFSENQLKLSSLKLNNIHKFLLIKMNSKI